MEAIGVTKGVVEAFAIVIVRLFVAGHLAVGRVPADKGRVGAKDFEVLAPLVESRNLHRVASGCCVERPILPMLERKWLGDGSGLSGMGGGGT